jgi:glycosyltransferase involved in cell wall biosynthesis
LPRVFPTQPASETLNGVRFERWGGFNQGRSTYLDLAKDFFYAARLARRLPAAEILVSNDFWLPVLAGKFRPDAGRIVVSANRFPKRQYGMYQRVACVVAASQAIARAIVAQTPAMAARVRCIPNPFDTRLFCPPAAERGDRSCKTVLYVGRLHPEKAVHILVTAFRLVAASHRNIALRIVGPWERKQGGGGDGYRLQLQRLAAGLPVTFSEPEFEVSKLAQVYQEADLFCYPSVAETGEALPVAPLEAMSTGLPVIVSNLDCFRDFIEEGVNGLVFDHRSSDPAATLAAKLEEALSAWDRSLEFGRRGSETTRKLGFSEIAGDFLEVFGSLTKQNCSALSLAGNETQMRC